MENIVEIRNRKKQQRLDWLGMSPAEKYKEGNLWLDEETCYDILNTWAEEAKSDYMQVFPEFEMPPVYVIALDFWDDELQDELEGGYAGYTLKPVLPLIGKKGTAITIFPHYALRDFQFDLLEETTPGEFRYRYRRAKREFKEELWIALASLASVRKMREEMAARQEERSNADS